MTTERLLALLDDLEKHEGWIYIQDTMKEEVISAAMKLADNPNQTEKITDYQRGAIWAGRQLLEILPKLRVRLQNEILVEVAKEKSALADIT